MTATPPCVPLLYEWLRDNVPERLAVRSDRGAKTSYGEVWLLARKVQGWLAASGTMAGDRVAVALGNHVRTPAALLGTFLAGACAVPMDDDRGRDPTFILEDAGCRAVLVLGRGGAVAQGAAAQGIPVLDMEHADALPPAAEGAVMWAADSMALLIYTSGSTGLPRGVVCRHGQVAHAVAGIQQRLRYRAEDVVYCCLPPSFDYGLYQYFLGANAGATVLSADRFNVLSLAGSLARDRVSVLPGVPALFSSLLKSRMLERIELPSLRLLTSTGDTFPPALIERLQALLPQSSVVAMYGLTECKRVSILTAEERSRRPDSVGQALDTLNPEIVDCDGKPLPPGHEGELVIRGSHVMSGYWRRPEDTAHRFRGDALSTGDRFVMDDEGYLFFRGRTSSFIKCNGVMVSPSEVEKALSSLDSVSQAVVVGLPDPDRGQRLAAALCCEDGKAPSLAQIQSHCRATLAPEMVPMLVRVVPSLPLTPNGKVDRVAALALFGENGSP